jgi:hypothetical protein
MSDSGSQTIQPFPIVSHRKDLRHLLAPEAADFAILDLLKLAKPSIDGDMPIHEHRP